MKVKAGIHWNTTSWLYRLSLFTTCMERTTEKDALIGVSMTGIASNKLDDLDVTESAVNVVKEENKRVAD